MNEIFRVSCARTWHEVVIHSTWSSECPYLVLKRILNFCTRLFCLSIG